MVNRVFFLLLIITLLLCAACQGKTSTVTVTQTQTTTVPAPATTSPAPSTTSPAKANWWDKFGTPQYGGEILTYANADNLMQGLDPYSSWGRMPYFEQLLMHNWTTDREIWDFTTQFVPDEYWVGQLAESWEIPDSQRIIFHLRKNVYWQNKPPTNGRQFTAEDVVYHYDRILGTGYGFTSPSPFHMGRINLWDKVTALDKFTVEFKFKKPTVHGFLTVTEISGQNAIEPRELVEMENGFKDWKNGTGTGPWILTDYTAGSLITYSKNPDYWGYDPRYPQNKLPYCNTYKVVIIPDVSTAIAALRTGKIHQMSDLTWQQSETLAKSDPKIMQKKVPFNGVTIDMNVNVAPYTDLRVRKALQMAIDIKTMAETYYGGHAETTPTGFYNQAYVSTGFCYPYKDWPQSLKDEYSFNPKMAKDLLTQAGYPNGFKTKVVTTGAADVGALQIIKSYWKEIGVDLEIEMMEATAWMPIATSRKFDHMICGPRGKSGATIPPSVAIALYQKDDMANFGGVNDPEYEALFAKWNDCTDMNEAKSIMIAAQKRALEQHWSINTTSLFNYTVWQPYLKGYSGEAQLNIYTAYLWIDQNLKKSMGH